MRLTKKCTWLNISALVLAHFTWLLIFEGFGPEQLHDFYKQAWARTQPNTFACVLSHEIDMFTLTAIQSVPPNSVLMFSSSWDPEIYKFITSMVAGYNNTDNYS